MWKYLKIEEKGKQSRLFPGKEMPLKIHNRSIEGNILKKREFCYINQYGKLYRLWLFGHYCERMRKENLSSWEEYDGLHFAYV